MTKRSSQAGQIARWATGPGKASRRGGQRGEAKATGAVGEPAGGGSWEGWPGSDMRVNVAHRARVGYGGRGLAGGGKKRWPIGWAMGHLGLLTRLVSSKSLTPQGSAWGRVVLAAAAGSAATCAGASSAGA